ncbi:hypothetical protein F0562_019856 [Nyssa sinensis]|uniref:Uncharacterized protein n=1 Tax=Nyssa sinensis TaxID=561372 RepID=A0A5J5BQ04_9ASTE|nr:hypothetical protein F0562_019856 [Nyssa sinensis]
MIGSLFQELFIPVGGDTVVGNIGDIYCGDKDLQQVFEVVTSYKDIGLPLLGLGDLIDVHVHVPYLIPTRPSLDIILHIDLEPTSVLGYNLFHNSKASDMLSTKKWPCQGQPKEDLFNTSEPLLPSLVLRVSSRAKKKWVLELLSSSNINGCHGVSLAKCGALVHLNVDANTYDVNVSTMVEETGYKRS